MAKLQARSKSRWVDAVSSAVTSDDECWKGNKMSFLTKLRAAAAEAVPQRHRSVAATAERLRGKVDFDGMERVSTQHLLDVLELPQRERTAGTYRRLAKLDG